MSNLVAVDARRSWAKSWFGQALQNRLIALVLVMIVAVPLFAAPADYSLTGLAALTLESFAVVLLTMLLWRARWDLRRENIVAFLRTGANLPVLLFLGWTAFSCLLSSHKVFSVQELLEVGAGALLYFVVAYQFRQSKHLSMLCDVLLFLVIAVAIGGFAQYQMNTGGAGRAEALFGDPQPLGSFLMLLLPLAVALALWDKNPRRQIVAQVASVLMVGCLLLTQGRSAWLGAAAGLVALGVVAMRAGSAKSNAKDREDSTRKTTLPLAARKHQFVMPAMLVLITLGFVLVMNSLNGNVAQRASTLAKLGTDVSWQSRLQTHWAGTWAMIQERPVTGWGAGLYPVYQHEFTGQGVSIPPSGTGVRVSLAEQAHNFYLQTAAELGLPGLLLIVAILCSFWVAGWQRIAHSDPGLRRTLLMASLAASVGFAFDALSSPSWQYAQNSMFLWLVIGMGVSCLRPRSRHKEEAAVPAYAPSRRVMLLSRPTAVAACLVLATLLPTAQVAAQSHEYGSPDRNKLGDIAFGATVVTLMGALIYELINGGEGSDTTNSNNTGQTSQTTNQTGTTGTTGTTTP